MIRIQILCLLSAIICCNSPVANLENEKDVIRKLLAQERKAHFEKDIDLFLSTFSDTMISLYGGEIYFNTIEENKARFGPYFRSVEFIKWDDIAEPVIDISEDGTMAYAAVHKEIVLTYPDTLGNPLIDSARYSWVSIYKKNNGKWTGVLNASTTKP